MHMKIKHTLKFKCEECREMLESKMDMRKHKAAKHAPQQVKIKKKKKIAIFFFLMKWCVPLRRA